MLRKLSHPSVVLAIGYAIGQGSIFIVQLFARMLGSYDVSGLLVIIVSLISFCFQFSDMGNSTYLLRKIAANQSDEIGGFLFARVLFSFFVCLLFSVYGFLIFPKSEMYPLYTTLPILGCICAIFGGAGVESRGDYRKLAFFNSLPWVVLSLSLLLLLTSLELKFSILAVCATVTTACILISVRLKLPYSLVWSRAEFWAAAQFVLPALGGQLFFRYIIFSLAAVVSLSELGALGIVRYFQVGTILLVGFIVRPKIRSYICANSNVHNGYRLRYFLVNYKLSIQISLAFSLLSAVIYSVLNVISIGTDDFRYWLPILFSLPLSVMGQAVSQYNQLTAMPKISLLIEYTSLLASFAIFVYLLNISPVLSILISESIYAITLIATTILVRRFSK